MADPAPAKFRYFDPHLILALAALAALLLLAESFSFYPPKLAGTAAADTLTTLRDLTVMAFMWYFHSTSQDNATNQLRVTAPAASTTTVVQTAKPEEKAEEKAAA